ncbi:MAG TPA: family 10 glycosylhydrolase [Candidatus Sumerlaeota bacterium]|nr:family 10 glycosylhydrolase [Candidatus Sumerlaeota bacterium]
MIRCPKVPRRTPVAVLLLVCLPWLAPPVARGQAPGDPAEPSAAQSLVSALWVSMRTTPLRDPVKLDPFLGEISEMPFDEIILQVVLDGEAFFNSRVLPRAAGLSDTFDPLETILTELHSAQRPIRVIAWLDLFSAGAENSAALLAPTHVRNAHPDWLSADRAARHVDAQGRTWLEPGLPEVMTHLEMVVADLVARYPVDGIYLGALHDPQADWGFHPALVERWQQSHGPGVLPNAADSRWVSFRANLYTQALRRLRDVARRARPGLPLSAGGETIGAPPASPEEFFGTSVYRDLHQDWSAWLRLQLLDRLYLKSFFDEVSSAEQFNKWMSTALAIGHPAGAQVTIGVSGHLNESVQALAQLRRAAEAGADGLAIDDHSRIVQDTGARSLFLSAAERTVFSPTYLQTLAQVREAQRLREQKAAESQAKTEQVLSATVPATTATSPTLAADPDQPLEPFPTEQATSGAPATQPELAASTAERPHLAADQLELPPPPPPDLEEADGRLIPAEEVPYEDASAPVEALPSPAGEDDETMRALEDLVEMRIRTRPPDSPTTIPAELLEPPVPPAVRERRETIDRLLQGGELGKKRWGDIRPDDQAQRYLREQFSNIFTD